MKGTTVIDNEKWLKLRARVNRLNTITAPYAGDEPRQTLLSLTETGAVLGVSWSTARARTLAGDLQCFRSSIGLLVPVSSVKELILRELFDE